MTFWQAIVSGFRKCAYFRGRASRAEYWYFWLFGALIHATTQFVDFELYGPRYLSMHNGGGTVTLIAALALLLPNMSVLIRRVHDTGHSARVTLAIFTWTAFCIFIMKALTKTGHHLLIVAIGVPLILSAMVGLLALLSWLLSPGAPGENAYGQNPLAETPASKLADQAA